MSTFTQAASVSAPFTSMLSRLGGNMRGIAGNVPPSAFFDAGSGFTAAAGGFSDSATAQIASGGFAMPTDYGTASPTQKTNRRIPITRHATNIKSLQASAGQRELVLIMRIRHAPVSDYAAMGLGGLGNHAMGRPGVIANPRMNLMKTPRITANLAILNYVLAMQQKQLFENDPDKYRALTPSSIWDDWSVDGAVMTESGLDGNETAYSDGFASSLPLNRYGSHTRGYNGNRIFTTIAKGEIKIFNVFSGPVNEGARLYLVIRKFDPMLLPASFTLSSKGPTGRTGGYSVGFDRAWANDARLSENDTPGFRPYLVAAISSPDGGILPGQYRKYTDEAGNKRYDGLAMSIGTVLHAPQTYASYTSDTDSVSPNHLKPMCNGAKGVGEELTVILDPTNAYAPF